MDIKKVLKIGTKLEIRIEDQNEDEEVYITQLEDFKEDYLLISIPIKKGNLMFIKNGEKIKISFLHKNNYYYFCGEVLYKILVNIPLMIVRKTGDIKKIQRRDFYRFKTLIEVRIKYNEETIDGIGKDISGSGMLLALRQNIKKGVLLDLELNLKEFGVIRLKGQVIRVTVKKDDVYPYEVGIKFIEIPEDLRELIIKYIFCEQRKIRQKGMV